MGGALVGRGTTSTRGGGGMLNRLVVPLFAGAILLTPFTGRAVLLTGLLSALLVATKLTIGRRRRHEAGTRHLDVETPGGTTP